MQIMCTQSTKSVGINPPELCNWLRINDKDHCNKPLHAYLLQNFNFQFLFFFFCFFFLPKHGE